MSLEAETKKAMGFIDKPGTCLNCQHFAEVENKYVDRMWDKVCTFSPLCTFEVSENSTCSKFKKRDSAPMGAE